MSLEAIVKSAGLSGDKSIIVMDALNGNILEHYNASATLPPASVTKAATALYALTALGANTAFKTRVLATGPIKSGAIQGDLILEGSGDPRLDTDALVDLIDQLHGRGVRAVRGKFYVYAGALPYIPEIDKGQPDQVGYNSTLHGMNLNFNRVFFEWKKKTNGHTLSLSAKGEKYAPTVTGIKISSAVRNLPVYSYKSVQGKDTWSVAQSALGAGGNRWLPVRRPADYAGEVFRSLAMTKGITLPAHTVTEKRLSGTVLASWRSPSVYALTKAMIKYSTNMIAEVLGVHATLKNGKPASPLKASARSMTQWIRKIYGLKTVQFVDHSGLGGDSLISAREAAHLLVKAKWDGVLRPLMKAIELRNARWQKDPVPGAKIVVKTGTLNFVSTLAGYIDCPNGRKLAFAILTADKVKRTRIPKHDREKPQGTKSWARTSRIMQHQLMRHWIQKYGL